MDCVLSSCSSFCLHSVSEMRVLCVRSSFRTFSMISRPFSQLGIRVYHKRPFKNLRHPRRTPLPPELEVNTFLRKKPSSLIEPTPDGDGNSIVMGEMDDIREGLVVDGFETDNEVDDQEAEKDDIVWEPDEVEAISSLFKGRIPQKPGKLDRQRPLPLPVPHKNRPLGLPSPKKRTRTASSTANSTGQAFFKQVYKNPKFLIGLAREIKALPPEKDVSTVLDNWAQFFRKGSLTLTIKELGHMDLPDKALNIYSWAQKQSHLFPDDRLLASTIEVLAMSRDLKIPNLDIFMSLSSKSVCEAMIKGFIKSGNLRRAYKLISSAKRNGRTLDMSVYSKLILELAKNPDNCLLILGLLEDLGERDDLNLMLQDCTAVMKVCIRLGKYETVESLFEWFKQSGRAPTVVMYTTLIHSRYSSKCYREALAAVWEMEGSNCLFDLPAYRVVIKLCVALNDIPRTVRYFSKLKEAGFSPPFDIYRDVFNLYLFHGRLAKFKEICREAEMAGFKLDQRTKHILDGTGELDQL